MTDETTTPEVTVPEKILAISLMADKAGAGAAADVGINMIEGERKYTLYIHGTALELDADGAILSITAPQEDNLPQ